MIDLFLKSTKYDNNKYYLSAIYFCWLASLLMYFLFGEYIKAGALENGVKLGSDSEFYLREARNILSGNISILQYKSKFGYLLFLIPFLYFDLFGCKNLIIIYKILVLVKGKK